MEVLVIITEERILQFLLQPLAYQTRAKHCLTQTGIELPEKMMKLLFLNKLNVKTKIISRLKFSQKLWAPLEHYPFLVAFSTEHVHRKEPRCYP